MGNRGLTYRHYESWDENIRCELIDGVPCLMAPPSIWHQNVAGGIYRQLGNWLEGKACKVLMAPVGVRLFPPVSADAKADDKSDGTVLEPDIIVVCDERKLANGKVCMGAPDFVVEVASKGTKANDFGKKKDKYEKAGVRESESSKRMRSTNTFWWTANTGSPWSILEETGSAEVDVLPGCAINLVKVLG